MNNKLVSIVSPCYNVAPYIGRFLDSLIVQTYKHLEIILVNDGSTDNTGAIIESYRPKLEAEGYKVLYIVQENGGLASAINTGLKYITGEYFTWPDPDDWLTPDSIEKRLLFLEKNTNIALVRCNIEQIEERTHKSLGFHEAIDSTATPIVNFFEKLVYAKTWFGSMACMVRTSCFDEAVPNREIYVTRKGGQNWQILLPLAFQYSCWQMPEVLGFYLIRENSHSRKHKSPKEIIAHIDMCEEVLVNTLGRLHVSKQLLISARKNCWIKKFEVACIHNMHLLRIKFGINLFLHSKNIKEAIIFLKNIVISKHLSNIIFKRKNTLN